MLHQTLKLKGKERDPFQAQSTARRELLKPWGVAKWRRILILGREPSVRPGLSAIVAEWPSWSFHPAMVRILESV